MKIQPMTFRVRVSNASLVLLLVIAGCGSLWSQGHLGTQPAARAADTQLHRAARAGDLARLRAELQQGADPNAAGKQGQTPLMDAVKAGQVEAAKALIESGANVNARARDGRTALIDAAEQGDLETTKLLIAHGADVNLGARMGTALEAAERAGHTHIAELLRHAGARSSGHSLGDTVCVRPWHSEGYCGIVEAVAANKFTLRVTRIVGCEQGCPAKAECSADKPVGGSRGIAVGDHVDTASWCLTDTGVKQ